MQKLVSKRKITSLFEIYLKNIHVHPEILIINTGDLFATSLSLPVFKGYIFALHPHLSKK